MDDGIATSSIKPWLLPSSTSLGANWADCSTLSPWPKHWHLAPGPGSQDGGGSFPSSSLTPSHSSRGFLTGPLQGLLRPLPPLNTHGLAMVRQDVLGAVGHHKSSLSASGGISQTAHSFPCATSRSATLVVGSELVVSQPLLRPRSGHLCLHPSPLPGRRYRGPARFDTPNKVGIATTSVSPIPATSAVIDESLLCHFHNGLRNQRSAPNPADGLAVERLWRDGPLNREPKLQAFLLKHITMLSGDKLVLLSFENKHPRRVPPLFFRPVDDQLQVSPTVQVVAKKWPEISIRNPFWRIHCQQHRPDREKWGFENQAFDRKAGRQPTSRSEVRRHAATNALPPDKENGSTISAPGSVGALLVLVMLEYPMRSGLSIQSEARLRGPSLGRPVSSVTQTDKGQFSPRQGGGRTVTDGSQNPRYIRQPWWHG